jgi:hypothetical protein
MAQILDVGITLSTDQLRVNAGEEARLTVTVHNNGPEIDCFKLEVIGLDPAWWEFDVPAQPLLPHQDPCKDCTFQSVLAINPPPNATALANQYPLEIRATPEHNDHQGTGVPVSFEILPFYSFECKLEPTEASGARGDFGLEFYNTGNKELNIEVAGRDQENLSQISFSKDGSWERGVNVCVYPGAGNKLRLPVRVQPFGRFLFGKPRVCNFTIVAAPRERGLALKEIRGRFSAISRTAQWIRRVDAFLFRPLGTPSFPSLRFPTWGWITCSAVLAALVAIAFILILDKTGEYEVKFQLNSGEEESFALPLPEGSTVRIAGNVQWLDSRGELEVELLRPDGSRSTSFVLPPTAPNITFSIDEVVDLRAPRDWQIKLLNTSPSHPAEGTLKIRPSSLK